MMEHCWKEHVSRLKKLYINCYGGGSNGWRVKLWKYELALFAVEAGLEIYVSHFPKGHPNGIKWNTDYFALLQRTGR